MQADYNAQKSTKRYPRVPLSTKKALKITKKACIIEKNGKGVAMVYISVRKILPEENGQRAKAWSILRYDDNKEFIDALLSRKNAESRRNSIEAYALLDEMLFSLTGIKKAVLRRGENGKPYIENENISFNITHTDGYVACVLDTDGRDVGIDAETIGRDGQRIIEHFFDEKAKDKYDRSDDKALAFAQIWTKKEAYAKFTGKGLSDYSTNYPSTCKFTAIQDGNILVTACTFSDSHVQIWQNDEDGNKTYFLLDGDVNL